MRVASALLVVSQAASAFVAALAQLEGNEVAPSNSSSFQNWAGTQVLLANNYDDSDDSSECFWSTNNRICTLSTATSTSKTINDCSLKAPVPTDNYVADRRKNKYDSNGAASQSPFVEITASGAGGGVASPATTGKTAWLEYATKSTVTQNKISMVGPGVYTLGMTAWDYDREATCGACVAIRDEYRPVFVNTRPAVPAATQSLTTTTRNDLNTKESAYSTYIGSSVNVQNNLGERCDVESKKRSLFYETSLTDLDSGACCFDDAALAANTAKLKANNPFPANLQTAAESLSPLLEGKCVWNCEKSKNLKEKYKPHSCTTTATESCVGGDDSSKIGFTAKATSTKDDIITATVAIKSTIKTASTNVLKALTTTPALTNAEIATKTANAVHYGVACDSNSNRETDDDCHYKAKLSALVDVTTGWKATFPVPSSEASQQNSYIFWRYNTDGRTWSTWDPASDSELTFKDASTTVRLQAWTACGLAYSYSFDVNLYVHSDIVCPSFDKMLKLRTNPIQSGAYCTEEGSDFGIVKLVTSLDSFLPKDANTVRGSDYAITCEVMVKDTEQTADSPYVTFLDSTALPVTGNIKKTFAVNLVQDPTTAQKTTSKVRCTFTRTPHNNVLMLADTEVDTDDHSETCSHTIVFTDCNGPELDITDPICSDQCAGDAKPGAYEACDGLVVSAQTVLGSLTTVKDSTTKTCCDKCNPDLSCTAIDSTGIKRCEVSGNGNNNNNNNNNNESEDSEEDVLLAVSADAEQSGFSGYSTTALLGASAMVAVVALFAAKQRASAAQRAKEENDVYFPLLE